jgi:hypothetical protein
MNKINDADFFLAMGEIGLNLNEEQINRILKGEKNEENHPNCHRLSDHHSRSRGAERSLYLPRTERS